jgi:predicted phosphodiesterase
MNREIVSVTATQVTFLEDGAIRVIDGLFPGTTQDVDGFAVTTLEQPGTFIGSIATTNDIHFGETICGQILGTDIGPVFSVPEGAEPYPTMMNRHAVAEITAYDPMAVVVKGDISDEGRPEEFASFLDLYGGAFEDRLLYVRGNHDSYRGQKFADWSFQERHLDGVIVALLDTARVGETNGSLSNEQIEQLDELGSRADRPVLVMGHHPLWDATTEIRSDEVFGLKPGPSQALLEVFSRRQQLVTYAAGHTHRNRVVEVGGVPFVEVASLKEFPGAWCEYQVFDGGILQIVRRVQHEDALAWSEQTRFMFEGGFGDYAWGTLEERCRMLPVRV